MERVGFPQESSIVGRASSSDGNDSPRKRVAIGERLARFRRDRGLSQLQLAERVGLTQRVMSYYEKGTTRIPADVMLKIADVLHVSVYEVLGRATSNRTPKNPKLWKVVEQIEALPPHDQRAVLRHIDALAQAAKLRS